jgi:hypothetical protein
VMTGIHCHGGYCYFMFQKHHVSCHIFFSEAVHSVRLFIVYMGHFLEAGVGYNCRKMTHMEVVDRGFTVFSFKISHKARAIFIVLNILST